MLQIVPTRQALRATLPSYEDDTGPAAWTAAATTTAKQPQVLPEEQYDMRTGEDPPGAVPVSAMPITIDLSTEADDESSTMRVTYTNYMAPRYHHHILSMRHMGSNSQCRHRWSQSTQPLWVTWWWPQSSYISHGLYCRYSNDLWTATWNYKVETMMKRKEKKTHIFLCIVASYARELDRGADIRGYHN